MPTTAAAPSTMPTDQIKVAEGFNVRENGGGIDELAGSIRLLGVLVPLIVTPDGQLIAGHRRLQAAKVAGLPEVPVVVKDEAAGSDAGVAAAENIVRQQLSPAEEADAIDRMIQAGYTADGAAQALAMPKATVTRRLRLLALPPELRELWGPDGTAKPSSVESVVLLLDALPKLAPAILTYHQVSQDENDEHRAWPVDGLAKGPSRYLHDLYLAMAPGWGHIPSMPKPGDFLHAPANTRIDPERDGFKGARILDRWKELAAKTRKHGISFYDGVELKITDNDVDAAVASGNGIDLPSPDGRHRAVTSRTWLIAHLKDVMLDRYEKALEQKILDQAKPAAKARAGQKLSKAEQASVDAAARTRQREKQWRESARGPNLDLGANLLNDLSDVVLTADIAKFFAEASLGRRPPGPGGWEGEKRPGTALAAAGLRYVMSDWQTEVKTPTKSNPAKTRIDYLPAKEAEARMWAWFDKAKTPGEILGRALIIHAAAMWAVENVLPRSQQVMASHANQGGRYMVPYGAAKRLEKITARSVPASVKRLIKDMRAPDRPAPAAESAPEPTGDTDSNDA